ncbi:beta-lactamase/transpeptidase-like protein [Aspergillus ellipticus CBS 707.79]|uniref:Beta-lactamase/transpeptidase-like protein n=1 Tax=Aspergillus ellipticus CBS 707.79 TaxID=1448320 RepID=A0A319EBJ4_9EURO|nr:beta-lactamase/transpeptidase-like protein [Aspergillus ellipticus CBS 707.79]
MPVPVSAAPSRLHHTSRSSPSSPPPSSLPPDPPRNNPIRTMTSATSVQAILEAVPALYRGPGGAAAVLQDGQLVAQHAWGYADLQARTPMTPSTRMPICSITKQMVILILKDLERNPPCSTAARGSIPEQLPASATTGRCPRSGARTRTDSSPSPPTPPKPSPAPNPYTSPPGTQYAYCNLNFHILARLTEQISGQSLSDLLTTRLFTPAAMTTAALHPDNATLPAPCIGYEGTETTGFTPAVNRMQWSGDAGVVASLTDMIAYEQYLHRDPANLYHRISQPPSFTDGTPARYGFGLEHRSIHSSVPVIGHGGALRGFRLHRFQAPTHGVAVVVMLNHEIDAEEVAGHILRKTLGLPTPPVPQLPPSPDWTGTFFDPEARLLVQTRPGGRGRAIISYAGWDEVVSLEQSDSHGRSSTLQAVVTGDVLHLSRLEDNRSFTAKRIRPDDVPRDDYTGEYHCADAESTFRCSGAGGMLYGYFEGFLGKGPMHLMRHL